MKCRKVFTWLLVALVFFAFAAPKMAKAAVVAPRTTVYLHKLMINPTVEPKPNPQGAELNEAQLEALLGTDVTFLPGAIFTYWKVPMMMDDPDTPDPALVHTTLEVLSDLTLAELDALDASAPVVLAPTDVNGTVVIPSLGDGWYYFRETTEPANVDAHAATVPFLLKLPVMNNDGYGYLNTVHIYPKNVEIRGDVELTKLNGLTQAGLPGAVFTLYKGVSPSGTPFDPDGAGPLTSSFTTDASGKIRINNLPYGPYYFIETAPPAGYLIDTAPIPFMIDEHHELVSVSLPNYIAPDVDKWVTTVGNEHETADYNENIKWIIEIDLPGDIATYNKLDLYDDIDPQLDYNDSLTIMATPVIPGADVDLKATAAVEYTLTEPVLGTDTPLQIQFVPSLLGLYSKITVTFNTMLNNTAAMGTAIENKATITYNNGSTGDVPQDSNEPEVHTGGKQFSKVADSTGGEPLAGAEFVIRNSDGKYLSFVGGTILYSWIDSDGGAVPAGAHRFTSNASGIMEVLGLAYGTYDLIETKAPIVGGVAYNLAETPWPFTINAASYSGTTPGVPDEIINQLGPQLPQTGGIGTLIFTLVGLGMMGSAVVVNKKQRD